MIPNRPTRRAAFLRPLTLAIILFSCRATLAQESSQYDRGTPPQHAAGLSALGSYASADIGTINLGNGALNINLPLGGVGGRGPRVPLTLNYSSKVWSASKSDDYFTLDETNPLQRWEVTYASYAEADYSLDYYNRVAAGWTVGAQPLLRARAFGIGASLTCYRPWTLTILTLVMPDGGEIPFRDDVTDGAPLSVPTGQGCGYRDGYRGRRWHAVDGSGAVYISDQPNGAALGQLAGVVITADGTRYRFGEGGSVTSAPGVAAARCTSITDRHGNKIEITYPSGSEVRYTDQLGRVTTVGYNVPDPDNPAVNLTLLVTSPGFNEAQRRYKVKTGPMSEHYREGINPALPVITGKHDDEFGSHNYHLAPAGTILFPYSWGGNRQVIDYEAVVTEVVLPDGRSVRFAYNEYGEVAEARLPTGGKVQYDYGPSSVPAGNSPQFEIRSNNYFNSHVEGIDRAVVTRRVYPDGVTLGATWGYGYGVLQGGTPVTEVTANSSGGAQLFRQRHLFHLPGRYIDQYQGGTGYTTWHTGLERRVETLDAAGAPVAASEQDWSQRASLSWNTGYTQEQPPNDNRVNEARRILETGQTARTATLYDGYNNPREVSEYDFDNSLRRRTVTTYLAFNPVNNVDYTSDAVRQLRLPTSVTVRDGADQRVAYSETRYDEGSLISYSPAPAGWSDPGTPARGNPTSTTSYANAAYLFEPVTTRATYDVVGNPVSSTDARGQTTHVAYSSAYQYAYPTATTSPVPDPSGGHASTAALTTATAYDHSTGLVTSQTDANSQTTYFNYDDPLDRLRFVTRPAGGGWTEYYYDRYNNAGTLNDYVRTRTALDAERVVASYQYFDGLGRPNRHFSSPEPGRGWQTVDTQYDALGRVRRVSNPYYTPNGAPDDINPPGRWTTTLYDALGRVRAVTTSDGATVTTAYSGNQVTVTDPAGKSRRSTTDALGRLTSVVEAPHVGSCREDGAGCTTSYVYDALSNLRKVEQGSQRRYFMYDSLSRLLRAKNPEQATYGGLSDLTDPVTGNNGWSMGYGYDPNGNLTVRVDARGVTTQYAYDYLNRNTVVSHSDATPAVYRYYDKTDGHWHDYTNGRGRLWRTATWGNGAVADTAGYDAVGRPRGRRQHFHDGAAWVNYHVGYAYNLAGGVTEMTYPSGRTVSYTYDDAGRLHGMTGDLGGGAARTYSGEIAYDERSQPVRERFGTDTQLYHKRRYNERGQLWDVRLSTGGDLTSYDRGAINLYYGADAGAGQSDAQNNGNVRAVQHYIPGAGGDTITQENYEYDELNRVRSATGYLNGVPPALFDQIYSYDRWGNRTVGTSMPQALGISYTPFVVEAATNRLKAPSGLGVMDYDAAGNLTTDTYTGAGTRSFDAEGRMTSAQTGAPQASTYSYDGDGRRVRRRVGGGGEVWQVYGAGGELLAEYAAGAAPTSPQKEYGYRSGELLIVAAAASAPPPPGTNLAAGKPTRQSSTAFGGAPSRAVDGNTSGDWYDSSVTHTDYRAQPWWEVDLGGVRQINEIKVWNRTDCCGERLSDFYVLVSDQPFHSDDLGETINQPGVDEYPVAGQAGRPTAVGVNRTGRYVRVQLAGTDYLMLAEVEVMGGGGGGAPASVRWMVSDHLGTPRMVADHTGSLGGVTRHDYLPFGEEVGAGVGGRTTGQGYVGNADGLRQRFTSKERDDETGLDYFLARYYSSVQGRFTSPDEFKGGPDELFVLGSGDGEKQALPYAEITNPQSLNKYTYVYNNPLRFIDPDGHQGGDDWITRILRWFYRQTDPQTEAEQPRQSPLSFDADKVTTQYAQELSKNTLTAFEMAETYGLDFGVTNLARQMDKNDAAGSAMAAAFMAANVLSLGRGGAVEKAAGQQLSKRFIVTKGEEVAASGQKMADWLAVAKNGSRGIVMEVSTGTNKSITTIRKQLENGMAYLTSKGVKNVQPYVMVDSQKAAKRIRENLGRVRGQDVKVIITQ